MDSIDHLVHHDVVDPRSRIAIKTAVLCLNLQPFDCPCLATELFNQLVVKRRLRKSTESTLTNTCTCLYTRAGFNQGWLPGHPGPRARGPGACGLGPPSWGGWTCMA